MAEASPTSSNEITAKLAGARQTLDLLRNQIKVGDVDATYWVTRLGEINDLLELLTEEYKASDQQRRLAALYQVSKALGTSLDLDQVLNQTMDAIIQLTNAERGFLMLIGDDKELAIKIARNMDQESLDEDEFAISLSVIEMVVKTGEQVVTTNASSDPRFSAQASVIVHKLRSIQCVPLKARGELIGVIYVDNRLKSGAFDEDDLDMLTAFATQAAMAIENARLFTRTDAALAQRVEELQRLQTIDQELNETLDFSRVMGLTLEWAVRATQANNGAIAIIDLDEGKTRVIAEQGKTSTEVSATLHDSQVINLKGMLNVPIQREGRVIGVIALGRDDGTVFTHDDQSFVLRLADHAAISIENARLYEAVKFANDAKTEFVSVMTHELRVPMTSIKGYAEMIEMMGSLTDQQKNFLEIIRTNVVRMSNLVSDLSDISRLESQRLKVEVVEDVSIQKALDEVLTTIQAEIKNREHTLDVKIPRDLPGVNVDPQRLNQILTNLVSNACKYTPDGGTITIRAGSEAGFVRVEVEDTGIGMTPEEISNLFTKFWRAEDRYVREQQGTGLGLAIAKNLVEIHGGEMSVDSEKEKGTIFAFTLPVSG
ncbi:MAG: GAF domain-containing protein [Anaerolineae bacterium]|nr:GAF domain-containing protein [Anaerolineae bacterium]